jgi:dTDP-glucose 4,6-dehydratase|tara:strand:- start:282 stop:1178 length:897 start_codon:yes stop_codon:yes gene_type:complete
MKDRMLITGGCGFIGSHFTDFQMGYVDMEVIVVDKLTYASNIDYLPEGAKLIKKDINDLTYDDIGEIQYCVNFAAESHVDNSIDDGSPFVKTNVNGTFNLLELCRQMKNFKKFVQISTDEVYGDVREPSIETDVLKPSSYYSATKAAADQIVLAAGKTYELPYLITRSCNNYGDRQHEEKFLPKLFKCYKEQMAFPLYGDGLNRREWIWVGDNIRIIDLLTHSPNHYGIYNVGTGDIWCNVDIVDEVTMLTEGGINFQQVDDRLGHDRAYWLDCYKLEHELGYYPTMNLGKYLQDTFK